MVPTVGRILKYRLSALDVERINRRRTTRTDVRARIDDGSWPVGAQAHVGNQVGTSDTLPMIVTYVGENTGLVNGQVFLDGNDTLWVIGARQGGQPGQWSWPVREEREPEPEVVREPRQQEVR